MFSVLHTKQGISSSKGKTDHLQITKRQRSPQNTAPESMSPQAQEVSPETGQKEKFYIIAILKFSLVSLAYKKYEF